MFRYVAWTYAALSLAMIATSLYTGHRATVLSGKPHYMLTRTTIWVEEVIAADNDSDAAYDAATRETDQPPTPTTVDKPCFVLGFADATGPVVLMGGSILLVIALWRRWRRPRPVVGQTEVGQV
jgi:hypothetical protein